MANSVDEHFAGKAASVREIYDRLVAISRGFGEVAQDPKKTSIHLNHRSAFAGIATRREFLVLTIKSTTDIDNPRISRHEQASANRWHHEIKLASIAEVDTEIEGWLRDSYRISG